MPTQLLDLPLEIRDQIWDHVIDSDKMHEILFKDRGYVPGHSRVVFPWASIAAVNRECHKEIFDNLQRRGRFLRFGVANVTPNTYAGPNLVSAFEHLAGNACFGKWIKSLLLEMYCRILDDNYMDKVFIEAALNIQVGCLLQSSTTLQQTTCKIWLQPEGEKCEDGFRTVVARVEFTFP